MYYVITYDFENYVYLKSKNFANISNIHIYYVYSTVSDFAATFLDSKRKFNFSR